MKKLILLAFFALSASAQVNISPNMGLPIPIPGITPGPSWASSIDASLMQIDSHNHSPGQGVQIQPNGMNINADLNFNSNNAIALRTSRYTPQAAPITNTGVDTGEVYVSGNELYYNDVSGGNQVQITSNGSVNATTSGISSGTASAAFSAGVLTVKSSSTSFGNVALRSILLANSGNLTNQCTLQAPTLSSSITETLPAVPASATSIMQMDTSGNMSAVLTVDNASLTITSNVLAIGSSANILGSQLSSSANIVGTQLSSSANIAGSQLSSSAGIVGSQLSSSAGILPGQLANGSVQSIGSSGSFSTTSAGGATVVSATISLTASRPAFVVFTGGSINTNAGQTATFSLEYGLNLSTIATMNSTATIPCSSLNTIVSASNAGGSKVWRLVAAIAGGDTVNVTNCTMIVIQ